MGKRVCAPLVHLDHILSACFDPFGERILTLSLDCTARLWWASTGKPIAATLSHGMSTIRCACFSPNGRLVATGGDDGIVRLWDAYTARPLGVPMRHDPDADQVQSVQFSADASRLFSSTQWGVWSWDLVWYGMETAGALLERVFRTFPKDAAMITEGDVLAAWPLSHEDIGKSVYDWMIE
jgi:hypothetical protein